MSKNNSDNGITIVKQEKKDFISKEPESAKTNWNIYLPDISFDKLKLMYNKSFVVGWITKKIATATDTGFEETESEDLNKYLKSFDTQFIAKNLIVFWNAFLEKVRNLAGTKFITTDKKLTPNMRKLNTKAGWYKISIDWKTAEFSNDEIIHFKKGSITNQHYWDSEFKHTVNQLILLHYIDKYYNNFFERWTYWSKVLTDPNGQLTSDQRETLWEFIKKELNGMSNSSATVIIPAELKSIDLNNELDTKNFLAYRKELIKSIAIGLDIPIDLIMTENSNLSTIQVGQSEFLKNLVTSLQRTIEVTLRQWLKDIFDNTDQIKYTSPNFEDENKKAEYLTKLVNWSIMTPNEARKKIGLDNIKGWDEIKRNSWIQNTIENVEKEVGEFYNNLQQWD